MTESAVRQFRRPLRIQVNGQDAQLAALVANVPGAIYRCALDESWTMSMISDEIERISGYPPADFVGNRARTFASVIHADDRADVEQEVRMATREDRPFALEYRIVRADGEVAWVLERGQLVTEADRQPRLHGVIFDISERKQAEEVLRRREAQEARIAELKAARARIIEAQDATRRRIERDLHDGAQQRLVTLALTFRLIKSKITSEPDAAVRLMDEASECLAEAAAELREIARGIHPVALEHGLAAALGALANRAPLPVEVDCSVSERLPEPIETAAYFVVAEALTNVARYSEATRAAVRVFCREGWALIEIEDNGIGGVDPDAGSGVRGLIDRIDALEGELDVRSDSGNGTLIKARIPLAPGVSASH